MFNNGDKVICINPFTTVNVNGPTKLIIGKTYIVGHANDDIYKFIMLENVFGIFDPEKFISLKEYRKQKINKICLK